MNQRPLATYRAAHLGLLATAALAAAFEPGAAQGATAPKAPGQRIVDPPRDLSSRHTELTDDEDGAASIQNYRFIEEDLSARGRTDLLRLRHGGLQQRGVHLGDLRRSGTCLALDG